MITEVQVRIVEEDAEGEQTITDLSAPTFEMAYEKMGAYERHTEEHREEDYNKMAAIGYVESLGKPQELEADELIEIEK